MSLTSEAAITLRWGPPVSRPLQPCTVDLGMPTRSMSPQRPRSLSPHASPRRVRSSMVFPAPGPDSISAAFDAVARTRNCLLPDATAVQVGSERWNLPQPPPSATQGQQATPCRVRPSPLNSYTSDGESSVTSTPISSGHVSGSHGTSTPVPSGSLRKSTPLAGGALRTSTPLPGGSLRASTPGSRGIGSATYQCPTCGKMGLVDAQSAARHCAPGQPMQTGDAAELSDAAASRTAWPTSGSVSVPRRPHSTGYQRAATSRSADSAMSLQRFAMSKSPKESLGIQNRGVGHVDATHHGLQRGSSRPLVAGPGMDSEEVVRPVTTSPAVACIGFSQDSTPNRSSHARSAAEAQDVARPSSVSQRTGTLLYTCRRCGLGGFADFWAAARHCSQNSEVPECNSGSLVRDSSAADAGSWPHSACTYTCPICAQGGFLDARAAANHCCRSRAAEVISKGSTTPTSCIDFAEESRENSKYVCSQCGTRGLPDAMSAAVHCSQSGVKGSAAPSCSTPRKVLTPNARATAADIWGNIIGTRLDFGSLTPSSTGSAPQQPNPKTPQHPNWSGPTFHLAKGTSISLGPVVPGTSVGRVPVDVELVQGQHCSTTVAGRRKYLSGASLNARPTRRRARKSRSTSCVCKRLEEPATERPLPPARRVTRFSQSTNNGDISPRHQDLDVLEAKCKIERYIDQDTGQAQTVVHNGDGSRTAFGETSVCSLVASCEEDVKRLIDQLSDLELQGLVHEFNQRIIETSQVFGRRQETLERLVELCDLAFFGLEWGATVKALDKAYKQLAKKMHPDRNGSTKEANDRFQEMKERYERLRKKLVAFWESKEREEGQANHSQKFQRRKSESGLEELRRTAAAAASEHAAREFRPHVAEGAPDVAQCEGPALQDDPGQQKPARDELHQACWRMLGKTRTLQEKLGCVNDQIADFQQELKQLREDHRKEPDLSNRSQRDLNFWKLTHAE